MQIVDALFLAELLQLALRFVHLRDKSALGALQLLDDLLECLDLLALEALLKLLLGKLVLHLRVNRLHFACSLQLSDQNVVLMLQVAHLVVVSLKNVLKF